MTKTQNEKLLPIVKWCANNSMLNNVMKVREICKSDTREYVLMAHGRSEGIHVVTAISLDTKKCFDVEILSDKCQQCLKVKQEAG